MDRPLIYETCEAYGKRSFTYCIAVSKDEIRDVTGRYIRHDMLKGDSSVIDKKYKAVLSKRTLVKEDWLSKTLKDFTERAQEKLTKVKKDRFTARRASENLELFVT